VVTSFIVKLDDQEKGFSVVDRRLSFDEDGEDVEESEDRKPTYVQELEAQLDESQRQVAEMKTQFKAAMDEFENAKARSSRDAALEIRKGRKAVLVEMLEVLDNLERAIEAAEEEGPLLEGITLVRDQFVSKLEHMGARKMSSLDQPFDPEMHQAVTTVPVDDPDKDGRVVGVVTEGYLFEEGLLRPAMVAVGKAGQ
jgi:molecular chaperone GrpE